METFQQILEKELEILNDSLKGTKYYVSCKRETGPDDLLRVSLDMIDGNETYIIFELDFHSKSMGREYYKIVSTFYSPCIRISLPTVGLINVYHSDMFSNYTYIASTKTSKTEAITVYKFWKAIVNSTKISAFFYTRYNTEIVLYTKMVNDFDVDFILNFHVRDRESENNEKRRQITSKIKFYLKKALEKV